MLSKTWSRIILVTALALAAAACGQKGDLYLPGLVADLTLDNQALKAVISKNF